MFNTFPFALVAFTILSYVSGLVVPRSTAPAGWDDSLEPYDTYHTRYLALDCQQKHGTPFFDECCHPLSATQSLETLPSQCTPPTATTIANIPTASPNEDDLECDEDDDGTTTIPSSAPVSEPSETSSPKKNTAQLNTGGFATFFYQNGNAGACGTVHGESDLIAAMDYRRYGNLNVKSDLCGRKIKITNPSNHKSVVVTVADACPTCRNANSIDLSVGAFKRIANLDQGIVGINWSYV
ncbi:hypothetical protein AMATHDRAFT_72811 [Amanita thiersii Skay4041]|uniref:RlpA-like protein double-psi beta-barrel domain-containing protein n=1 Tax=Amanita thiersii Skay4041 TaxID=703135 RepID=A0A2A9NXR4_9AGAR|nr:hypothetical protein AMATHDRAFT_72811 [Amanita thiersii Skay4041]